MSTEKSCKNCGCKMAPDYQFCPSCGQEVADNLTIGLLFSNTISNYFSVDARFFRSFIPLMLKPGVLARRFVDGKRQYYLHPAQFYLFISVLFFFLFSFTIRRADNTMSLALKKGFEQKINLDSLTIGNDTIQLAAAKKALKENKIDLGASDKRLMTLDSLINSKQTTDTIAPLNVSFGIQREVLDSLIANAAPLQQKLKAMGLEEDAGAFKTRLYRQLLKFYEQRGGGILKAFYDTIPIAMFLLMPLFAFLLKVFYWRRGNFAHHMVFSFYFFTFVFTSLFVLLVVQGLIEIPIWLEILFLCSFLIYLIMSLKNFYRSSWLGAILKANTISFIYLLIIIPMAFFGLVLTSLMLY
ncbi:DUF3667 domain-containing protein [Flavobacteriaceae bacterium KMM 6897]|nr:DUF3667 domain-containing protein [Flavobacteriaceae bacterium KMM 6897]